MLILQLIQDRGGSNIRGAMYSDIGMISKTSVCAVHSGCPLDNQLAFEKQDGVTYPVIRSTVA